MLFSAIKPPFPLFQIEILNSTFSDRHLATYSMHSDRISTFTDQIPVSQIAKLPLDIVLFDLKEWKSACDDISEWKNVLYSAYFDLYE